MFSSLFAVGHQILGKLIQKRGIKRMIYQEAVVMRAAVICSNGRGVSRQTHRPSSRIASSSTMHFFVPVRIGLTSVFILLLFYQTAGTFAMRQ